MVRNSELKGDLLALNHRLDLIETVLLVSNPDSAMAADAYAGLRKTILQSFQATQALYATIAQLDSVASASDDVEDIRVKLRELMLQYGVAKVEQYEVRPDAFERVGQGSRYIVTKPAYVASPEMPPIQMGVAETSDEAPPAVAAPEQVLDTDVPARPDPTDRTDSESGTDPTGETT